MAELRRAVAPVEHSTGLCRTSNRSAARNKKQVDWQILISDLAVIVIVYGLLRTIPLPLLFGERAFLLTSPSLDGNALSLSSLSLILSQIWVSFLFGLIAIWYFWSHGHYARRRSSWDKIADVTFMAAGLGSANILFRDEINGATQLAVSLGSISVIVLGLLLLCRHLVRKCLERSQSWLRPTVVVGSGKHAVKLAEAVAADQDLGLLVTHILEFPPYRLSGSSRINVKGRSTTILRSEDLLAMLLLRFRQHIVLLAPSPEDFHAADRLVPAVKELCPSVGIALPHLLVESGGPQTQRLLRQDATVLWIRYKLSEPVWQLIKRCFDLLASCLGLFAFSPLFLGLWIYGLIARRPVLYRHKRIGRNGLPFFCLKFRTMVPNAQDTLRDLLAQDPKARREWEASYKLKNDPRVTTIGAYLRHTSLDELPQLWNVLKGEMSLVGPRPIVPQELKYYGDSAQDYLKVKPGLTGLWQVSGRSNTDYDRRVALDRWYVRNWCLWYDLVIVAKTVRSVLSRCGAY